MDPWTFATAIAILVVVTLLGLASMRILAVRAEAEAARARSAAEKSRLMRLRGQQSGAARRKKGRSAEDDDEEEEDEGDDLDEFFDTIDSQPLVAGVVQAFAAKEGIDLEALRRREPDALLKADALLKKLNQTQQQAGPAGAYL